MLSFDLLYGDRRSWTSAGFIQVELDLHPNCFTTFASGLPIYYVEKGKNISYRDGGKPQDNCFNVVPWSKFHCNYGYYIGACTETALKKSGAGCASVS